MQLGTTNRRCQQVESAPGEGQQARKLRERRAVTRRKIAEILIRLKRRDHLNVKQLQSAALAATQPSPPLLLGPHEDDNVRDVPPMPRGLLEQQRNLHGMSRRNAPSPTRVSAISTRLTSLNI